MERMGASETPLACPAVPGAAALLLELKPERQQDEAQQALQNQAHSKSNRKLVPRGPRQQASQGEQLIDLARRAAAYDHEVAPEVLSDMLRRCRWTRPTDPSILGGTDVWD